MSEDAHQLKATYAAELHKVKSDVQTLKSKFYERQSKRVKFSDAQGALQGLEQIDQTTPVEVDALQELQQIVATELLDPASTLPVSADALHKKVLASSQAAAYRRCMGVLHQPCLARLVALLAAIGDSGLQPLQPLLAVRLLDLNGNKMLIITDLDRAALADFTGVLDPLSEFPGMQEQQDAPQIKRQRVESNNSEDLAHLLQFKTVKERDRLEKGEELLELLDRKTARQQAELQLFQTGGAAVHEYCSLLTKEACRRARGLPYACNKLHQRKILYPWTDESLGNCNWLDTCKDVRRCKYIHYELDPEPDGPDSQAGTGGGMPGQQQQGVGAGGLAVPGYLQALPEPQWIRCDIRHFDFSILGKFGVIMTDPPWEIHQDLPYGTMSDDELLNMGVAQLQDDGVIFMWVTGRALELGRELLTKWGYRRVDELIWVKTNSLQRLIRTGRTGHWLNHSKEHCLVGYKGNPNINRFVDCDVLVSDVRETSRKPDEMYPLLERLSPGTRKLEIFARQHNVRPGWVSLGNQLDGVYLTDPELLQRYISRYGQPERPRKPPPRLAPAEYHTPAYGGDW